MRRPHTRRFRLVFALAIAMLSLHLDSVSSRAQDPNAAQSATPVGASGSPAGGGPGSSSPASGSTTDGDEEAAFDGLVGRMETTPVPLEFSFPSVFSMDVKQAPVKIEKKKKVEEVHTVPNADLVKRMFQAVRVSSISITTSRRIAVVAYKEASLRVHPGDTVLGAVQVREIEKERVLFQYTGMPPIWIYRVRPGMPPPEVVAQQQ